MNYLLIDNKVKQVKANLITVAEFDQWAGQRRTNSSSESFHEALDQAVAAVIANYKQWGAQYW